MFSFLFKSKKECFICYSTGKTIKEEHDEIIYHIKTMNYPLISMDKAYGCKWKNYYAHNKCLLNIDKCPTCRHVVNPKLYITTRYDYYIPFLLNWLKKDKINIFKLNKYMIYCLIFGILILGICALFEKELNESKILQKKSLINLCFSICIVSLIFIPLYIFTIFNDYLKKYWLLRPNENTIKYDVFRQKNSSS